MAITLPPVPSKTPMSDSNGNMTQKWKQWWEIVYNRLGGATQGFAPDTASFIVKTPEAGLTNEQALSTLPSGYMKSATGTGAVSTVASIPNTDITGLGTLSTQNGTFSGTSSGTNTGDQDLSAYALKASSLAQFAATTSAELKTLISDETGSGALVFANTPTFATPILGVASATSINFGGSALGNYLEDTWTPVVTLVGGAGNTVPQYTVNQGIYTRIGNQVHVDIALSGDGGNEGAGTGTFTVTLPIAAAATTTSNYILAGTGLNNATRHILVGFLTASSTALTLGYFNTISTVAAFTGADQNSTTRIIKLHFTYEV